MLVLRADCRCTDFMLLGFQGTTIRPSQKKNTAAIFINLQRDHLTTSTHYSKHYWDDAVNRSEGRDIYISQQLKFTMTRILLLFRAAIVNMKSSVRKYYHQYMYIIILNQEEQLSNNRVEQERKKEVWGKTRKSKQDKFSRFRPDKMTMVLRCTNKKKMSKFANNTL